MKIVQIITAENYWLKITEYYQCDPNEWNNANNMYDSKIFFKKIIGWAVMKRIWPITIGNFNTIFINTESYLRNIDTKEFKQKTEIIVSYHDLENTVIESDPENPNAL